MSKPIFVDLWGSTARVDPQAAPNGNIRLSVMTEQRYDYNTGQIFAAPQALEVWITADQADALADALKRGRCTE